MIFTAVQEYEPELLAVYSNTYRDRWSIEVGSE